MSVATEGEKMGVVNMARDIKKVHPNFVVMYKVGNFVQAFGKDAYIISYIFGYSLRDVKDNIQTCGFPKIAIPKIMAKLEEKKINYIIIDTRNNYEVDEQNNNNLNTYEKNLIKAHKYIKIKKRIEKIEENILNNVEKENIIEKIRKIEEIVNEN